MKLEIPLRILMAFALVALTILLIMQPSGGNLQRVTYSDQENEDTAELQREFGIELVAEIGTKSINLYAERIRTTIEMLYKGLGNSHPAAKLIYEKIIYGAIVTIIIRQRQDRITPHISVEPARGVVVIYVDNLDRDYLVSWLPRAIIYGLGACVFERKGYEFHWYAQGTFLRARNRQVEEGADEYYANLTTMLGVTLKDVSEDPALDFGLTFLWYVTNTHSLIIQSVNRARETASMHLFFKIYSIADLFRVDDGDGETDNDNVVIYERKGMERAPTPKIVTWSKLNNIWNEEYEGE